MWEYSTQDQKIRALAMSHAADIVKGSDAAVVLHGDIVVELAEKIYDFLVGDDK